MSPVLLTRLLLFEPDELVVQFSDGGHAVTENQAMLSPLTYVCIDWISACAASGIKWIISARTHGGYIRPMGMIRHCRWLDSWQVPSTHMREDMLWLLLHHQVMMTCLLSYSFPALPMPASHHDVIADVIIMCPCGFRCARWHDWSEGWGDHGPSTCSC